jgi:EmrB/QacA subfamily drug resistance transporter
VASVAAPLRAGEVGWRRRSIALAALCTILFLTFLDNTVVAVALASIQSQLHAGVSGLQWVVGAYALTFAALMLAFGVIGDEFGRKRVMLAGAGVYCAGAVVSALSGSMSVFIAGRSIMGLGAAASEPGTLSMIRQLYADERSRNRALGVWAAVSGFSLALGPVLGGILVGLWSFRAIFWFDVTFGLAALVVAARVLPESSDPRAGRLDISGTVLGAAALGALVFGVLDGETSGFTAPHVLVLFVISAVAVAAFVLRELRATHPLLDLRLARLPAFATPNAIAFCCYFATFAIFFFTALYLAEVSGYSGYRIAALFVPMTAVMIVASLLAGRWTTTAGVRTSLLAGCVLFAGGLLATNAVLGPHASYLPLAAALALAGAGLGACVVPVTSSVLAAVPAQRSGMAASATNTSREVGAVVGVVALGALVNAHLRSALLAKMAVLHLPAAIQAVIINLVETGGGGALAVGVGSGGSGGSGGGSGSGGGPGSVASDVAQLYRAGYAAFETALHQALLLSAGLIAVAAVLAAVTLRPAAPKR